MAYDIFHETVRHALHADGWTITHDPLIIPFGDTKLYVDFGAERLLAAEKAGRKIAVEVKSSSLGRAALEDYHLRLLVFDPDKELIAQWIEPSTTDKL